MLPPFTASQVQGSVVLIPPLADGSEVQEKVIGETVSDLQRYIQLADKLLEREKRAQAASNAA